MPIDPMISMAVAVQARSGVYALLLGSGVSRSSGMPTAWEVVVDLCNRVADLSGEERPLDPEKWCRERMGSAPPYSTLLAELAKSPADRSQLLRGYFEPTDEERDEGLKTPTGAHRAIARMVASGHIRVIVTTNFDRLIEQALADEGVTPSVIWSPASAAGMTPLQHSNCTVLKLHGDYLDLDTKNTLEELSEYPPEIDTVLDQILTEYGLIVCGWSGDWDPALREAILRCTRHRFSTFWLHRSALSQEAQRVADVRHAMKIEISSADECFVGLEEKVRSLGELRTPHPVSEEVAKATTKRLLAESRFRIRLEDYVDEEATRMHGALGPGGLSLSAPPPNETSVRARAQQARAIAANLAAILMVGCYWGSDEHHRIWRNALERTSSFGPGVGQYFTTWAHMRLLPATYALYAGGIAALAAGRYDTVKHLLLECTRRDQGREIPLIEDANAREAFGHDASRLLYPAPGRKTPGSDWLHEHLGPALARMVGGDEKYTLLFHRFELLLSMCYRALRERGEMDRGFDSDWMPDGRYIWQYSTPLYTPGVFKVEIEEEGDDWPPLRAGMFDGSAEVANSIISGVEELWSKQRN